MGYAADSYFVTLDTSETRYNFRMHTSAFSEDEATNDMDVELFLPVAILRIDLRQTFHSFSSEKCIIYTGRWKKMNRADNDDVKNHHHQKKKEDIIS